MLTDLTVHSPPKIVQEVCEEPTKHYERLESRRPWHCGERLGYSGRYRTESLYQALCPERFYIDEDHQTMNLGSHICRWTHVSKKMSTVELGLTLGQGGDEVALHAVSSSMLQSSNMVPAVASTPTKLHWRESWIRNKSAATNVDDDISYKSSDIDDRIIAGLPGCGVEFRSALSISDRNPQRDCQHENQRTEDCPSSGMFFQLCLDCYHWCYHWC